MDTVSVSAAIRIEFHPLAHVDASNSIFSAGSINHVLNISNARCAGYCGDASNGDTEFLLVGAGAAPATIPRIAYTDDGGNTWTLQTIAVVANGVAEQVAVIGNNVIVAVSGTNGGVYRAPLDSVKLGTATFAAVTGISTGAAYNAVKAIGSLVFAAGAAGALYISRDGGYSFTALTTGVAGALNAIAGDDENVVWVGGENATLLRIRNTSIVGAVTGTGLGGTDDINALAVPTNRTNELYIGTAQGDIFRSRNATAGTPTFEEMSFDKPSGGGVINDIQFSNDMGAIMWVVQTDGSGDSRVMVDRTGGQMGVNAVAIGTFADPANSGLASIAPANADFALTVGAVQATFGFIGKIFG
jgi:photosystem II stability/assembly factor-like uncharacterized protein